MAASKYNYAIEIPEEIWERVFLHLDLLTLTKCQRICRAFRTTIATSPTIQYLNELTLNGLIETTHCPLVSGSGILQDRLAELRDRRERWTKLDWTEFKEIKSDAMFGSYDFVDGTYSALERDDARFFTFWLPSNRTLKRMERKGDMEGDTEGKGKMAMAPARTRTQLLDFVASDFIPDPTQDIIIFLTPEHPGPRCSIRVLTFSTLQPHPEAQHPIIFFTPPAGGRYFLQMNKDMIACTVSNRAFEIDGSKTRLFIWNWKTGKSTIDKTLTSCHDESFSFVTPDIYLVAVAPMTSNQPYISIYSVSPDQELARLMLPQVRFSGPSFALFTCFTGPFLAHPPHRAAAPPSSTPSSTPSPLWKENTSKKREDKKMASTSGNADANLSDFDIDDDRGYALDPRNKLFAFKLLYFMESKEVHLMALGGTFLEHAKQAPKTGEDTEDTEGDEVTIVPWSAWGPKGTKLFVGRQMEFYWWHCFIEGSRIAVPCPTARNKRIRILDFNPELVSFNKSLKEQTAFIIPHRDEKMALGDRGKGFITRKLSLEVAPAEVGSDDSESPFLERVETHLPCYCVERDVPIERYKSTLMSWKIDAERIIGVFNDSSIITLALG